MRELKELYTEEMKLLKRIQSYGKKQRQGKLERVDKVTFLLLYRIYSNLYSSLLLTAVAYKKGKMSFFQLPIGILFRCCYTDCLFSLYILYVFNQLRTNKDVVKYFKTTYAPDEMVVPTIIMNSGFAQEEYNLNKFDFSELAYLHYLHYRNGMYTFDENDFEKLMSSGKLFARKFVSNKSERLINLINQHHKENL